MPWDFVVVRLHIWISFMGRRADIGVVRCMRFSVVGFWEVSLGMAVLIALVFGFPVSVHVLVLVVYCRVFFVCVSYYVSGCLVCGGMFSPEGIDILF